MRVVVASLLHLGLAGLLGMVVCTLELSGGEQDACAYDHCLLLVWQLREWRRTDVAWQAGALR
jgi:hypothetical protein